MTAYRQQVEATHAALQDANRKLTVPVGTVHSFQGREFGTVVFDLVEDGRGWVAAARWRGTDFERAGVRLFGVGITRARRRLYLIVDRHAVTGAQGDAPLGAVRRLERDNLVQWCRASVLLGMADSVDIAPASPVEAELGEVLRGLVDVTDIHDEFAFDEALREQLTAANTSVWMWSPWVGRKSRIFVDLIAAARGVAVRVARQPEPAVQYRSREVMLAIRGAAFATRLLTDLNAEAHGDPPHCDTCDRDFGLWRSSDKRRGPTVLLALPHLPTRSTGPTGHRRPVAGGSPVPPVSDVDCYQPLARHSARWGRSAPRVVSSPWPG
ncbi:AAA domain-containing protein [Actinokineospora inagensis]|uniref:AAA domain-containing protein n=1 Tax=Actinokineospora inagensis TaxID=103730 RepID=UPI00047D6998|nr:AAA domain-containing protein [Actinokineospora inagensis]